MACGVRIKISLINLLSTIITLPVSRKISAENPSTTHQQQANNLLSTRLTTRCLHRKKRRQPMSPPKNHGNDIDVDPHLFYKFIENNIIFELGILCKGGLNPPICVRYFLINDVSLHHIKKSCGMISVVI